MSSYPEGGRRKGKQNNKKESKEKRGDAYDKKERMCDLKEILELLNHYNILEHVVVYIVYKFEY